MIEIKNLTFSYTKQPFITDMTFSVEKGGDIRLLGPLRCGKKYAAKNPHRLAPSLWRKRQGVWQRGEKAGQGLL